MKIYLLLTINYCMCIATSGASLMEMTNEELSKRLRSSDGFKYMSQLEAEINEPESDELIEKCRSDDVLKKYMYLNIHSFPNEVVRDKLSLTLMRDHDHWEKAGDETRPNIASEVSECMWTHLPSLAVNEADRMALAYTLQSTQGRNTMADIYERYLNFPIEERYETHPNVAVILDEIRVAIAKFGTLEWVYPGEIRTVLGSGAELFPLKSSSPDVHSTDQRSASASSSEPQAVQAESDSMPAKEITVDSRP